MDFHDALTNIALRPQLLPQSVAQLGDPVAMNCAMRMMDQAQIMILTRRQTIVKLGQGHPRPAASEVAD